MYEIEVPIFNTERLTIHSDINDENTVTLRAYTLQVSIYFRVKYRCAISVFLRLIKDQTEPASTLQNDYNHDGFEGYAVENRNLLDYYCVVLGG